MQRISDASGAPTSDRVRRVAIVSTDELQIPIVDETGTARRVSTAVQATQDVALITNAARTISTVGGSLRDVQMLAGHRALSTTQRYIEADLEAQKRVVDLV